MATATVCTWCTRSKLAAILSVVTLAGTAMVWCGMLSLTTEVIPAGRVNHRIQEHGKQLETKMLDEKLGDSLRQTFGQDIANKFMASLLEEDIDDESSAISTLSQPNEVNTATEAHGQHSLDIKMPDPTRNETCDKSCRWWRQQSSRKRRVQETCSRVFHQHPKPPVYYHLTPETLRGLSHLLVLDSHKLIYCFIPKVSCTNWKRIFLVAKGIFSDTNLIEQRKTHIATDSHMRTLSSYPIDQAVHLLKTYKKFIFVRHPFERILSAYIDKFQMDYPSSKHFREANAAQMALYGNYSNTPKLKDGTLNITIQQFSRYVSDLRNERLEPHWQEMYSQCQPCMVNYDYIGNYGTLKEDADFIIELSGLGQTFPESTNPTGSSNKMKHYFSQLTSPEIDALYRRYSIDFQLFGYTVPSFLTHKNITEG